MQPESKINAKAKTTALVKAGDAIFLVELAESSGGPSTASVVNALPFDGVRETIEGLAAEFARAYRAVRPEEATVEFGLSLTTKTGRLTGLLVEGGGTANLKVTMKWKCSNTSDSSE